MARRAEVAYVNVGAFGYKLSIVCVTERDGDDVTTQDPPELFGDVIGAETVLEGEVEEVVSFEKVVASGKGVSVAFQRTAQPTATAVYVDGNVTAQLFHVPEKRWRFSIRSYVGT